jgi:tRNA 2-thiouridine synthesizing protein A
MAQATYSQIPAEGDSEETLDVSGLLCPLPVLKARKVLERLRRGRILKVVATDPMAAVDMAHFCSEQGHTLLAQDRQGATLTFMIERG